jgi:ketosteroid isomerase-like protein
MPFRIPGLVAVMALSAGPALAVHAQRPLAFEVGTYAMKLKDGTVADRGKYVVVWLKEDGKWKLHRDIWNTSLPAPAPPAKK